MATPTYDLIDSVTLSSAAASVTFSGISATGKGDLIMIIDSRNTSNVQGRLIFNSDTGSNYNYVSIEGLNSSQSASADRGVAYLPLSSITGFRNLGTLNVTQISDFSATNKYKSTLTTNGGASVVVSMHSGRWASTSAITSITIQLSSGNLGADSTFYLYQVASE